MACCGTDRDSQSRSRRVPPRQSDGRTHDIALGAADVGDDSALSSAGHDLRQQLDILADRRRQDDQIDWSDVGDGAGRAIDRAARRGVREYRRPIDRGDEDRRPPLAHGERDRPADQAQADYRQPMKWWF
jgi:hypothetical protein